MNKFKKLFTAITGYWIHNVKTLPVGADLYIDIDRRINYGPFNTLFDVGANVGQTWQWFRQNYKSSKIYCFEPVSVSFKELKNAAANDNNCILENIAFGDIAGQKTIKLFDNSALNSLKDELINNNAGGRDEVITIDTIDNYCAKNKIKKIDFLKIDTEGYELKVLEGAKKMLLNGDVSFIFCEIGFLRENNRNTYFADLTEWLATKDYYFFGMYQLVSNGFRQDFGNALYIHKGVFKKK